MALYRNNINTSKGFEPNTFIEISISIHYYKSIIDDIISNTFSKV